MAAAAAIEASRVLIVAEEGPPDGSPEDAMGGMEREEELELEDDAGAGEDRGTDRSRVAAAMKCGGALNGA
jgi:hypothetical protein